MLVALYSQHQASEGRQLRKCSQQHNLMSSVGRGQGTGARAVCALARGALGRGRLCPGGGAASALVFVEAALMGHEVLHGKLL